MKCKGNPLWGRPSTGAGPASVCEFDRLVLRLGLKTKEEMIQSREVQWWVREHANRRYVPEWLLRDFGI